INKALDQVADFNLENTNLDPALKHISDQTKINFVIDRFTITNQFGIDPNNAPINLKLTGVKTRTALRSVLNQYNLGYAIIGDTAVRLVSEMAALKVVRIGNVLFITNKATAQEMRQDPDLAGPVPGQTSDQAMPDVLKQLQLLQPQQQFVVPAQAVPPALPVNP